MAQIVKLKKEHVEEYKACHARVWPEVLKQIKESGIEDCKFTHPFICSPIPKRCFPLDRKS